MFAVLRFALRMYFPISESFKTERFFMLGSWKDLFVAVFFGKDGSNDGDPPVGVMFFGPVLLGSYDLLSKKRDS